MFLWLLTRLCVFPFHEQHNHDWHVPTTFHSQRVRMSISWGAQSWLTCSCDFWLGCAYFKFMNSIITTECSRHFSLSAGAYVHFMSGTIMADMFPSLLTFRECVFPFHELHNHCWHVPATFDSQRVRISTSSATQSRLTCSRHFWLSAGAYVHFMSGTIMADIFPPLLTIRWCVFPHFICSTIIANMFPSLLIRLCVFPFHEWQNHGWHVSATFDSQRVRISISLVAQSLLTSSCHFRLSQPVGISIS